jgi:anthranilate phosphoribosyltransferase
VTEVRGSEVRSFTVTPEDAGFRRAAAASARGGDAAHNAEIAREILGGAPGPRRDVVLLNAAAALVVADKARDLLAGVALASAAIDDGRAAAVLDSAREID